MHSLRKKDYWFRRLTSFLRCGADFLIIGAQKSGTSSLHEYLCELSGCVAPAEKEVAYFSNDYALGEGHYHAFFPTYKQKGDSLAFESTAHYLYKPNIIDRVKKHNADMKLIVVLRDPVSRAISHFGYKSKKDWTFNAIIREELEKIRGHEDGLFKTKEDGEMGFQGMKSLYVVKGLYALPLRQWIEGFGREKMLVLQAEKLFQEPDKVVQRACDFLGIANNFVKEFQVFNKGKKKLEGIDEGLLEELRAYYEPFNQELYELIGEEWNWGAKEKIEG